MTTGRINQVFIQSYDIIVLGPAAAAAAPAEARATTAAAALSLQTNSPAPPFRPPQLPFLGGTLFFISSRLDEHFQMLYTRGRGTAHHRAHAGRPLRAASANTRQIDNPLPASFSGWKCHRHRRNWRFDNPSVMSKDRVDPGIHGTRSPPAEQQGARL